MEEMTRHDDQRKSRVLESLICAQMDDLRDAAKLADYAESAKNADKTSIASYFVQQAKGRLTSAAELERHIDELTPDGDGDEERMTYRHALKRYKDDEIAAIKRRLEKLM